MSEETGVLRCGRNTTIKCSVRGCCGKNLGLQLSNKEVQKNCIMWRFLFYSSPEVIAVIKFRRWEHDLRMGRRRNAYVGNMRNGGYLGDWE